MTTPRTAADRAAWKAQRAADLADFDRAYLAAYGTLDCVVMRQVSPDSARWAGRLIAPATSGAATAWQSTLFHADGLYGHEMYATRAEAIADAYTTGFRSASPAWVDEIFISAEFIRGERAAAAAGIMWEAFQMRRQLGHHGPAGQ